MIFLNSASSTAALVFYLPVVCTHTDTEENKERPQSGIFLKIREKNTILMNILYNGGLREDKLIYRGRFALKILNLCEHQCKGRLHFFDTFFSPNDFNHVFIHQEKSK